MVTPKLVKIMFLKVSSGVPIVAKLWAKECVQACWKQAQQTAVQKNYI